MIKFIPVEHPTRGNLLTDPTGNIHNISSRKLSNQLDKRFEGKGCEKHPTIDSVLLVDLSKSKSDFIQIQSYCCDAFKAEVLDLLVQNKDPYSGSQAK